jgi:ATPase subunit of ABC transporter with duplicated ATPase domains
VITVKDLEMRYGRKGLFSNVNLQLMPGCRYGLIGANGSGKSTFLKVLSGEEQASGGSVQIPSKAKLGVLNQDQFLFDDYTLMDAVLMGKPDLYGAMQEMEALLQKEDFSDAEGERVGDLEMIIAENDGYTAEPEAASLLEGLGLPHDRHQHKMKMLSGGYKLRVLLAQVLFSDPDMMFLDEPTNHLDLYSIKWLETYLCKFKGALVVISHDRDFVNGVSTHILDVDFGSVTSYKGNYDAYVKQVEEDKERRESVMVKAEKRKDELQEFVDRFKAKASKAKQAQSKAKMIDKLDDEMEKQNLQPSSRKSPALGFKVKIPSGVIPLEVEELFKSYGTNKVLHNVSFEAERGECLAIVGPNGIGKSTLLKIMVEETKLDTGSYKWGHQASISYFPQDIEAEIQGKGTVHEWLQDQCSGKDDGILRKSLARALFSGDDSKKAIGTLSGGERARLILARMMVQEANILIFDEPTNHLDIESIEALRDAIKAYEGTVFLVSHNRWFVSHLADRVLEILPEEVRMHEGGYQAMLKAASDDHLDRNVKRPTALKKNKEATTSLSSEERQKLKQEEKELNNLTSKLEGKISQIEAQIQKVNDEMLVQGFYDDDNEWKRKQTLGKLEKLQGDLEMQNQGWESTGQKLDGVRSKLTGE